MIRSPEGLHLTGKSKARRRGDQGFRGPGPLPRRGIQRVPIPDCAVTDMNLKRAALDRTRQPDSPAGDYHPDDPLIAWLQSL